MIGAAFTITSDLGVDQVLQPSEQATFTIQFSPTDGAVYSGSISFTNDDFNENPFDFEFFAIGDGPELFVANVASPNVELVSGAVIDMGILTPLMTSTTATFNVNNIGYQGLSIVAPANFPVGSGFHFAPNLTTTTLAALTDTGRVDVDDAAYGGPDQVFNTLPTNTLTAGLDDYQFTLTTGLDANGLSLAERYGNGVYLWEAQTTFTIKHTTNTTLPTATKTLTMSGEVLLTDNDTGSGNPFGGFGNGWGIGGLPSLWYSRNKELGGTTHQDDTVILVDPAAESRLFVAGIGANSGDPWRAVVPGDRTSLPKELGTLTHSRIANQFTYVAADQTVFTFEPAMMSVMSGASSYYAQLRKIDPVAGPDITFSYMMDGRLQSITSSDDSTTNFAYTMSGELDAIQMPGGRTLDVTVAAGVDANSDQLTGLSISNFVRSFGYNSGNRLESDTFGSGLNAVETHFSYDTLGLLNGVTLGSGANASVYGIRPASLYTPDPLTNQLPTAFADLDRTVGELLLPTSDLQKYDATSDTGQNLTYGLRKYYFFDANGRRDQESLYATTIVTSPTITSLIGDPITDENWEWDNFDNVTYFTDSAGRETRFTYDYNLLGQSDDVFNKLVEEFYFYTQATYQYETTHGWLIRETAADGTATNYIRNSIGQVAVVAGAEQFFQVNTWGTSGVHSDILLAHSEVIASLDFTPLPVLSTRTLITTFAYDSNRRVSQATTTDSVSSESRVTTYGYTNTVDTITVGGSGSSVRSVSMTYSDELNRVSKTEVFDAGGTTLLLQSETEFFDSGLVSATEDGDGVRTEFAYDVRGYLISTTAGAQNPSVAESTTTSYYANEAVKSITAPDSQVTTFFFDPKNRVEATKSSRVFQNWNTSGNPVFIDGVVETTRDIVGNVILTENSLTGLITEFEYDPLDRPIKETMNGVQVGTTTANIVQRANYDAVSNQVQSINGQGIAVTTDHDRQRNATFSAVVQNGAFSSARARNTFGYDSVGMGNQGTEYRTAAGIHTSVERDGFGRVTSQTDPDGLTTSVNYVFDTASNLTKVTTLDRNGITTHQFFDGAGRLRMSINAAGDRFLSDYTLAGRLDEERIEENTTSGLVTIRRTEYGYDDLGRGDSVKAYDDVAGGTFLQMTTFYDFGPTGRRITVTDPAGNLTVQELDGVGNATRITQPDPLTGPSGAPHGTPVTTFAYDYAGVNGTATTSVTTIDPLGRSTRTDSNALGWLLKSYDAAGLLQVANEYDLAGRVIQSTDALGNFSQTTYYEATGLVKSVSVPVAAGATVGAKTEYEYDASGNRTKLTDPESNVTLWEYDVLNRVTKETIATAAFTSDTTYITVPKSRLWNHGTPLQTVYTDRNGRETTYVADPITRTNTETWDNGRVITHTFNAVGDLVGTEDQAGSNTWTQGFEYNDVGWLTQETFAAAGLSGTIYQTEGNHDYTATGVRDDLEYRLNGVQRLHQVAAVDGLDRVWKLTQTTPLNPSGLEVQFTYRADGSLDQLQRNFYAGSTSSPVAFTKFDYFANGDLQTIKHQPGFGGTGVTPVAQYDYTYDDAHRIDTFTSLTDGLNNYGYDAQNQLTSATGTSETYTYDDNGNRTNTGYLTGPHNLLIEDATYNYVYDAEGNRTKLITKETDDYVEYTWDRRNRLTSLDFRAADGTPQKRVEYDYNVNNLRIQKIVYPPVGPTNNIQRYGYDGDDVAITFNATNVVQQTYFHGPAVDQVFADEDSVGQVLWALTDHQGSVRDWVDNTGTVEHHTQYGAFGQILSPNPADVPMFAFTGREWDPDAGLYYYRARWYDPVIGRFVSDDPTGFGAGDVNIQRYVGNGPTNNTDPSGLDPEYGTLEWFQWLEAQSNPYNSWFQGQG